MGAKAMVLKGMVTKILAGGIGFAVIGAGLVALTFILRGKKPEAE